MSLLLTLNIFYTFTPCCSVSIVNYEHVIAGWDDDMHPLIVDT